MSQSSCRQLPYRIPGPAGDLSYPTLSTTNHGHPRSSSRARRRSRTRRTLEVDPRLFYKGAWQAMLKAEQLPPYGKRKLGSCVRVFEGAVKNMGGGKVARIILRVIAMEFVAQEARVLLGDITGFVVGTVHGEVFKKRKKEVEVGAVVVLKNVSGLLCCEDGMRDMSGAWNSGRSSLHLSIHLSNIVRVFQNSSPTPIRSNAPVSGQERLQELQSAYTPKALTGSPETSLVSSRPLTRRSSSVPSRNPFRPSSRPGEQSGLHPQSRRPQLSGVSKKRTPPSRPGHERVSNRRPQSAGAMGYPQQQRRQEPQSQTNYLSSQRPPPAQPSPAFQPYHEAQPTQKRYDAEPQPQLTSRPPPPPPTDNDYHPPGSNKVSDEMLDDLFAELGDEPVQTNDTHVRPPPDLLAQKKLESEKERVPEKDLKRNAMIDSLLDGLDASQFGDF